MSKPVYGITARAPRPTWTALRLITLFAALPLIAGLVAFDIVVWWVFDAVWGVCVGVWCWF